MADLHRDGVRLHYEDHGKGLPVLLTHGFAASTGMWRGQIQAFRDRYRLIPWDMRGHGQSDSPQDPALYSQDRTVEDMAALLDHLGVDRAVLAGHSLGGYLSLAFHQRYPERVLALVLQGCGPGYRNPEARAAWNRIAEKRAETLEREGLAALRGGSEVGASTQRSAAGLARAARGILKQVDARVIDDLPRIAVPTLIVAGDGDEPYLAGTRYMASRIRGAELAIIEGAGHGANVDRPERFDEVFGAFLERIPDPHV